MGTKDHDSDRLRAAALSSPCDEFGFSPSFDRPFLVMMEVGQARGTATLVAIRDQNPSLYVTPEGDVMCGISDDWLRAAATKLIDASEYFTPLMGSGEAESKPRWGKVRFSVRTSRETFTVEQAQLRMTTGTSAFSVLFDLCNEVVAELNRSNQVKALPPRPGTSTSLAGKA